MKARDNRLWVALSLLLLLVLVASACTPAATPTPVPPTAAPTKAAAVPTAAPTAAPTKAAEPTKPPAEKYPTRPVKMVLTHPPGGWLDTNTRLIAPYIQKYLGQSVVIENMDGAGGRKARAYVFKAAPDGYTLLTTAYPTSQLGEVLYQGDYKTAEFTHISTFAPADVQTVCVSQNSTIKTYKELVDLSKTKVLKIGTGGTATPDHVAQILLKEYTGLQSDSVPFDSGADAIMAVLGGKIDAVMVEATTLVSRPDLRPLVVVDAQRSVVLPNVPTVAEAGYKGFDLISFLGVVAPPGLSEDKRQFLEDVMAKANADPEYVAKLKTAKGLPPLVLKGAAFKAKVVSQFEDITKVQKILEAAIKQ